MQAITFTTEELTDIVKPIARRGENTRLIVGLAALDEAVAGDLSFLGNSKYRAKVATTRASIVLIPPDHEGEPASGQCFMVVDNPSVSLARVCARIEARLWPKPPAGIHPSAIIGREVKIAPGATIGPLCVIEDNASIGEGTYLQANVFVGRNAGIGRDCRLMPGVIIGAECRLHDRVRLHSGVVVGSDGFGYEFVEGKYEKVPQIGIVTIEDDVEIGANSTLDRARFSRTVIGEGTKIDNLVQVAHNVVIGRHCILCAQVGISGSAVLEDFVILGGQAGVAGHITVGKGVKSGARAGITSDIEPGVFVHGYPAMPYMLERRLQVLQRRLPELFKRVTALEEKTGNDLGRRGSGQD